jgi:DNA-binding transcriptional MerR regulator/quercetin dioxygenase-like cupin family protein
MRPEPRSRRKVPPARGLPGRPGFKRPSHDRKPVGVYIRQAAAVVGVSPALLRAWEAEGLIRPARTPSGYRVYDAADIERLRHIRDLIRRDGLNPAGVRRLLDLDTSVLPEANGGLHIGERIGLLRRKRRVSLRKLADLTGLSPSYISSLERSLSKPSVASLQKLAAALGTNVPTLLGERPQPAANPVVRPHERPLPKMEVPGVKFENLSIVETDLEPLLMTIEPGAGSRESYQHGGEEFLYMLEGYLELTLDEMYTYSLGPGDAMTFASGRPHRWWNPGEVDAVIVWINTPPTF